MSSNGRARPTESARDVAAAFFEAVRAGDAEAVWESFSDAARAFIAARGRRRGLGPEAAEAILDGTADPVFHERFVADVLAGIEHDLERIRLHLVEMGDESVGPDHRTRVVFLERFEIDVGPPLDPLPVGSVLLVVERGRWKVDRLVPRPGG